MRFPYLCFICLLPAAAVGAQELPRLRQASAHNPVYYFDPQFIDVNKDQLPDIFLPGANSYSFPALYRNLGNRAFAPGVITNFLEATSTPQPRYNSSPKLVFLQPSEPPVIFFHEYNPFGNPIVPKPVYVRMDRPGTFGRRISFPSPAQTGWQPLDLDDDGQTEFIELSGDTSTKTLTIRDRMPDGTYGSVSFSITLSSDSYPVMEAVDLNQDGLKELVLHTSGTTKNILKRTGPRSFAPDTLAIETTFDCRRMSDVDGDGLPDFLSDIDREFGWRRNMGDFSFQTGSASSLPAELSAYVTLGMGRQGSPTPLLHLYRRESDLLRVATVRGGSWEIVSNQPLDLDIPGHPYQVPSFVGIDDFDRDGFTDCLLQVIMGSNGANGLAIAWGGPSGFSTPAILGPLPIPGPLNAVADFDLDGRPDLIRGLDPDGRAYFFPNPGDGAFADRTALDELLPPAGSPTGTFLAAILVARVNGDAVPDLVVTYRCKLESGGFRIATGFALGNGDGSFSAPVLAPGSYAEISEDAWQADHAVDWDGDGDIDVIGGGRLYRTESGVPSAAGITLATGTILPNGSNGARNVFKSRVGDLDGDGHPDIVSLVSRTEGSGTVASVSFNDGTGGIATTVELAVTLIDRQTLLFGDLALEDMDSDGLADICTKQFGSRDILGNPVFSPAWRKNPGGGSRNPSSWTRQWINSSGDAFPTSGLHDFNGDGVKEWVSPKGYLQPTPSGPVAHPVPDMLAGASLGFVTTVIPGDFDGDSDVDFLIGNDANLTLVKNPSVDERSSIVRGLVRNGVNGNKAGPDQDADGDGLNNFLELAYGTDPLTPNAAEPNPLGLGVRVDEDGASIGYSIPYYSIVSAYPEGISVDYTVERSTNLRDWEPDTTAEPELIFYGGGRSYLRRKVDDSSPAAFFRLSATHWLDEE